ncbi:MAG: CobD/CbiB family protein [Rhodocyclaceae bacterium]|nr:CobD/CbiB family protein [Rhodocyclaceae bacterium]
MALLAVFTVFLLEQLKAAPAERLLGMAASWAEWLERHCNGGQFRHALWAWGLGVAAPALLIAVMQWSLAQLSPLLGFVFTVIVLYGIMGFRQFSHAFTDIHLALRMGELERARATLGQWRGRSASGHGRAELARLTIEEGLSAAYRFVFAPLFWFLILGPGGALLYRLAAVFVEAWKHGDERGHFFHFAEKALFYLDWLPVRLTAMTFAIVGDFEDAIYCWRTQAAQWPNATTGILLAAGAGALGVKLGQPIAVGGEIEARPELGLADNADVDHLASAIGLVWRTVVVILSVLALMTLAAWLG